MKQLFFAICAVAALIPWGDARSDADDVRWIARCMRDNANAKVSPEVVTEYCTCMNDQMDDNETRSITQWEKSHPDETEFCVRKALGNRTKTKQSDDMKWISRCMKDNADADVSPDVVIRYCTCMNNKMDDNETRSITQWEKSHPRERKECDRESGWR